MNNFYSNNETDNNTFTWDSVLVDDGNHLDFIEDGPHMFRVKHYERGYHEKNDRFGHCPMARIYLEVTTEKGPVDVEDRLYLVSSMKWRLISFFRCVIPEDLGKQFSMPWNRITGASGIAEFSRRKYTGSDGKEHTALNIKYLPYTADGFAVHNSVSDNPFKENISPENANQDFENPFAS